jgi:hypothetical protein
MLYYNLAISIRLGLLCVTALMPLPSSHGFGRLRRTIKLVVGGAFYCRGFGARNACAESAPSMVGASTKCP